MFPFNFFFGGGRCPDTHDTPSGCATEASYWKKNVVVLVVVVQTSSSSYSSRSIHNSGNTDRLTFSISSIL